MILTSITDVLLDWAAAPIATVDNNVKTAASIYSNINSNGWNSETPELIIRNMSFDSDEQLDLYLSEKSSVRNHNYRHRDISALYQTLHQGFYWTENSGKDTNSVYIIASTRMEACGF